MTELEHALNERFLLQEEYLGNNKIVNSITPVVSVTVATYQHVNFIKECLDGILMQQTNFPYEIILGEDGSTDGTQDICKEYAEKYPDKIRLFIRDRKLSQFVKSDGKIARFNSKWNKMSARGKYIAICEGDDYWIDPYKLQKQVDFLEGNEDVSMCFHNAKICRDYIPSSCKTMTDYGNSFPDFTNCCYVDVKTLVKKWVVPTASIVFRRKFCPNETNSPLYGDQLLILTMAENGLIYYMPDTMSVYRILPTGMNVNANKNKNSLPLAYKRLKQAQYIRKRFKQIPFMTISVLLADRYWGVFLLEMKENHTIYFKYFFLSLLNNPVIVFRKIIRQILKLKK